MKKDNKFLYKFILFIIVCALTISTFSFFVGCNGKKDDNNKTTNTNVVDKEVENTALKATTINYSTGVNKDGKYDNSLFYNNDFSLFSSSPDPSMFYYDGYYYMYGTSGGVSLVSQRTKDFANWEYMGVAYDFNKAYNAGETWARQYYWAPEAFEWNGKFYMYVTVANSWNPDCYPEGLEYIGEEARSGKLSDNQITSIYGINPLTTLVQTTLLVSDNPQGPFKLWTGERTVQKYFHGEKVGNPCVEVMTAQSGRFFDFANAPAAWEKNKFLFDKSINRVAYEAAKNKKYFWDVNLFANLDASWFVDTNGDYYMFFTRQSDVNGGVHGVWGIKMINPWTPDYSTLTELTEPRRLTVNGEYSYGNSTTEGTMDGGINEGPFTMSHTTKKPDGSTVTKYYLTYSTGKKATDNNWGYNIAYAVADSPLGPYKKMTEKYGNPLYMVSPEYGSLPSSSWTHGSGHGTFCNNGSETFLVAHSTQSNSSTGTACERMAIIDRLVWEYNEKLGYDLPHMNGPSKNTIQPQPSVASGYKNIVGQATVTATNMASGSNVKYLNDDYRVIHERDEKKQFRSQIGGTTITLTFDTPKDIRAIMVYNSRDIEFAFSKIDYILFENDGNAKIIKDLIYPESGLTDGFKDNSFIRPAGSAVAEFEQMKVKKISIKITKKFDIYEDTIIEGIEDDGSMYGICISDIVILGRDNSVETQNTNYDEDKFNGSTMMDYSNIDVNGKPIVLDRNLFDISGSHCHPIYYVCNADGSVNLNGGKINVPFKNDATTDNSFAVSIKSQMYGSTNYSKAWNNGAIAIYTGSQGSTNLQFRIFAVKYDNDTVEICFNHYGNPWTERFYQMEYKDYAGNGAPHTLTVAFTNGVYHVGFAKEGGEMRYITIDKNTPFRTTANKGSDVNAMFTTSKKVIGLATIDAKVKFDQIYYACDQNATLSVIESLQNNKQINLANFDNKSTTLNNCVVTSVCKLRGKKGRSIDFSNDDNYMTESPTTYNTVNNFSYGLTCNTFNKRFTANIKIKRKNERSYTLVS